MIISDFCYMRAYHHFLILIILLLTACGEPEYLKSTSRETSLEYLIQNSEYRILAIGNSFLEDATRYLPRLMEEQKESAVLFCRLHKGGTSLEDIWKNHVDKQSEYELYYTCNGSWYKDENCNVDDVLAITDWDAVSLQQLSDFSGIKDTYLPFLPNLHDLILNSNSNPEIIWHQTWSYSNDATLESFSRYGYDSNVMLDSIRDVTEAIKPYFDKYVPSGEIIQKLRVSPYNGADNLTRDGKHLDNGLPCYALSCLWHEMLITPVSGKSSTGSKFRPSLGRVKVTDESAIYVKSVLDSLIHIQ